MYMYIQCNVYLVQGYTVRQFGLFLRRDKTTLPPLSRYVVLLFFYPNQIEIQQCDTRWRTWYLSIYSMETVLIIHLLLIPSIQGADLEQFFWGIKKKVQT